MSISTKSYTICYKYFEFLIIMAMLKSFNFVLKPVNKRRTLENK